jgi:hypothetical protein
MMNDEAIWSELSGYDTSGLTIFKDLSRLVSGQLNEDECSELLLDLIRENQPSTAGYAALPYLLNDCRAVSAKTRFEMLHAACMILGLASEPGSPEIPPNLAHHFHSTENRTALRKLFKAASEVDLSDDDIACVASVALLLKGDRELYGKIIERL